MIMETTDLTLFEQLVERRTELARKKLLQRLYVYINNDHVYINEHTNIANLPNNDECFFVRLSDITEETGYDFEHIHAVADLPLHGRWEFHNATIYRIM